MNAIIETHPDQNLAVTENRSTDAALPSTNASENPSPNPNPNLPSASSPSLPSPRGLSRLEGLTDAQLAQLNTWHADAVSFRKMVDLCREKFSRDIPKTTIQRYFKRTDGLNLRDDSAQSQKAATEISRYAATGDPTFSATTLHILEKEAFDLALVFSRDGDAEDLDAINRLNTIICRHKNTAVRERHAQVQEDKCKLREQELELKIQKANSKSSTPPKSSNSPYPPGEDHLGPRLRHPHDYERINARARKFFNISDEEAARRRALRKAHREAQAKLTALAQLEPASDFGGAARAASGSFVETPCNADNQPASSSALSANSAASTSTPNPVHPVNPVLIASPISPEDLAKIVDAYTVKRGHEYHNHYRTWADPHSYRKAPPQYITEFRHCPCGHASPCPIHENEEGFGPFPDWFWTRSPHSPDYARCLRDRDLPYRDPKELLA